MEKKKLVVTNDTNIETLNSVKKYNYSKKKHFLESFVLIKLLYLYEPLVKLILLFNEHCFSFIHYITICMYNI
jgi:hypothetical protein